MDVSQIKSRRAEGLISSEEKRKHSIEMQKNYIKKGEKRMKKFFAIFVAVAMIFTFASVAFAANDGVITVTNATNGQKYTAYQILELENFDAETNSYSYKPTGLWADFIDSVDGTFVSVDDNGYVTWLGGDIDEFAKAAKAYADEEGLSGTKQATAANGVATISGLPLGYYLVDSTVGTICSLDTTDKEVEIEDKNEITEVDKEVQEDSTEEWGETNDASIGETVNYKATVTKQKGAVNYVLHDKMDAGLTFLPNSVVAIGPDGEDDILTAGDEYTLTVAPANDNCTFEIAFDNEYIDSLEDGDEIIVTYSAVVNEDAVIAPGSNDNTIKLKFGDNNDLETVPVTTETFVFSFDLVKTNAKDIVLEGAEFKLWADEDKTEQIAVVKDGDEYRVATASETGVIIVAGNVTINGLDSGTYYLEETKAPAGFNKLDDLVEVVIDGENLDATVTLDNTTNVETYVEGGVQVINNSGAELPSTGGMGTTIFYLVGAILVAGAAIILFSRKRMAYSA